MRQRGQALILSILALLVLTLLGLTLTGMGILSMSASTNEREASEALYTADSGVAHAAGILALDPRPGFDAALQAGDAQACTGDELSEAPDPPAVLPVAELIPATGRTFASGSYRVSVCDDDAVERTARPPASPDQDPNHDANFRVLVRSTGLGRNGASATVEAILTRVGLPGLLVDGPLRLSGGLALLGPAGSLHANGAVELQGDPCAGRYFSASGRISGAGLGGGGCTASDVDVRPLQARIPVPTIEIAGMRRYADHVLGADGFIRKAGSVVALQGWTWDGGSRRWAGDATIPGGTYYAEGSVELSGDSVPPPPNEPRTPLSLSVIAEGWIDVKSFPLISALPLYTLVAGSDLRLQGDPDTTYAGLFYAGDQLGIEGSPALMGQFIVKNAGDAGYPADAANPALNNLVRLEDGYVTLRGDSRVVCPGGGLGTVLLTGWRECRGNDPDNPCGVP